MKDKLLKLLKGKEDKRTALVKKANETEDIKELRSINAELEGINGEIEELRGMIAALDEKDKKKEGPEKESDEKRSAAPVGETQVMATYGVGAGEVRKAEPGDPLGTLEYRTAFMEFIKFGKVTPALKPGVEARADAMTTVADVSAIIPTTILNELISKVQVYGQVFQRVRKTSIKGGVNVPILSLKPTATWIGEAPTSEKKKIQINTNISFSYYGLECKVSTSLLADTVTLAGFESTVVDLVTEAMVKAIDLGVVKGTGEGQMLGITADTRVPAGQVVTLGSADFGAWDAWKKNVFAKMPLSYKAGAVFLMASGTFEGYIDGMVDANGQPVGRINYGITNGPQERFGGKEVIQVEDDVIAPYDDANVGDVVAIYCNLSNYVVNSNMQMTMFRYFDHDTNEWVNKAILIADGKLVDANGVVIIKKGA
jgi:HK97 family phage major capsid protein